MKFAIIEDHLVTNIAVADEPLGDNWVASEEAKIGDEYVGGLFVTPPPDPAPVAAAARAERNARLSACDWTQLADAPVDGLAWAVYRQELREVPQQSGFPFSIQWPEKPE
jgi:hypothetical protein